MAFSLPEFGLRRVEYFLFFGRAQSAVLQASEHLLTYRRVKKQCWLS